MKTRIFSVLVLCVLLTAGLLVSLPSGSSHELANLAAIQGGIRPACVMFIAGTGLGLLAGAAITGGIGLAIAGAYVPLLAAMC
jgi:hypothetical protein